MGRSTQLLSRLGERTALERRATKSNLEQTLRTSREAVLVVNTRARRGERLYAEAKAQLAERGLTLTAAYPVSDPVRLPEIVAEAVLQGGPLVVVGGGDGTISSVVDFFAYRDVALGVVPLGTANSFARSLGIPLDVAGAVEVITSGKIADVDLGCIGDDLFANSASLGMSPAIGRKQPYYLKRYLGRAGYLVAAGRAWPRTARSTVGSCNATATYAQSPGCSTSSSQTAPIMVGCGSPAKRILKATTWSFAS